MEKRFCDTLFIFFFFLTIAFVSFIIGFSFSGLVFYAVSTTSADFDVGNGNGLEEVIEEFEVEETSPTTQEQTKEKKSELFSFQFIDDLGQEILTYLLVGIISFFLIIIFLFLLFYFSMKKKNSEVIHYKKRKEIPPAIEEKKNEETKDEKNQQKKQENKISLNQNTQSPQDSLNQKEIKTDNNDLEYIKYYSKHLSKDPVRRINYLLDVGNGFSKQNKISSAKQIYSFIFEEYKNLISHNEPLYQQIVAYRRLISS